MKEELIDFKIENILCYSIIGRYYGIKLGFLNGFIVTFSFGEVVFLSKIKQLCFTPVLILRRGYVCLRF